MHKYPKGFCAVANGRGDSHFEDASGRRYSLAEIAGRVPYTGQRATPEQPLLLFFKPHITPNGSGYSDRLLSWDWDKHNMLCQKHFGNQSQLWGNREPRKIEAFLRDYNELQTLELTKIEEHVNWSNGFHLWYFEYYYDEQELQVLLAARAVAKGKDVTS